MDRLNNKIAFITGAGGGIGRAICKRFVEEGAHIAAIDINLASAQAAIAGLDSSRTMALQCDASDPDGVQEAIAQVVKTFGALNVICNVAGGSTPADNCVTEAPIEEFWRAIKLDLFGTFLCCKYGLPELMKAGGGSVINMTSMAALVAIPKRDCYTAAKGGVSAMTRSMAAHYARYGIRINAIAPSVTTTPRVSAQMEVSEALRNMEATHLLGFLEPLDVAQMAVFLASDESGKVTGQILAVDSGVTII
jgi:NAD(P)-dependent dehydrogenase (short-subunit alcohol dehydrogenase family)